MKTVAMILAAGASSRMGFPKQTAVFADAPVLLHTLRAFEAAASIDAIVVVARPADCAPFTAWCRQYGIRKLYAICAGGDTRQQSAANGLAVLPADSTHLAVHDGARPLVTPALIDRVVAVAKKTGAAAAAVPVRDTVKQADADRLVTATVDRRSLWLMQTPQVFRLADYRRAMAAAAEDFTDDCALFEQYGLPVQLVEGSYTNLKITTPEDLMIAGALWEEQHKCADFADLPEN